MFKEIPDDEKSCAFPFSVLLRILENEEIGEQIVDEVFHFSIERLYKYKEGFPFSRALINSFSQLLEQLEEGFIWNFLKSKFENSNLDVFYSFLHLFLFHYSNLLFYFCLSFYLFFLFFILFYFLFILFLFITFIFYLLISYFITFISNYFILFYFILFFKPFYFILFYFFI